MLPIIPCGPQELTPEHPFRLNTGCNRDQWHTMTRSAKSPQLSQHLAEPIVELHPDDAARLNIVPDDLVEMSNRQGRALVRALITPNTPPGQVFAAMHRTAEYASAARMTVPVPGVVDPVSGQPESKSAPVALRRFAARWFGFAISAATVIDSKRGVARVAFHAGDRLLAALFAGRDPVSVRRDHMAARLHEIEGIALAGRPAANRPDPGATVCACLNVGINGIRDAILSRRALSVAALGIALGAGTSCGSCRPDLAGLLASSCPAEAAECSRGCDTWPTVNPSAVRHLLR